MRSEIAQPGVIRSLRILYPIWVLLGIFSIMYVPSTLIEYTDALATVENIAGNSLLFRLGIAGRLTTQLLFIVIPFLLFLLFKNYSFSASALMLILALVSIPISMYNETINLSLLGNLDEPERVMAMIGIYDQGMIISTIFWGLWLVPLGWLVYKSTFFPKLIGIVLFMGGVGYLMGSFMKILFPDFDQLNLILEVMTFGELIFIIWLVIVGVKNDRAHAQQA